MQSPAFATHFEARRKAPSFACRRAITKVLGLNHPKALALSPYYPSPVFRHVSAPSRDRHAARLGFICKAIRTKCYSASLRCIRCGVVKSRRHTAVPAFLGRIEHRVEINKAREEHDLSSPSKLRLRCYVPFRRRAPVPTRARPVKRARSSNVVPSYVQALAKLR